MKATYKFMIIAALFGTIGGEAVAAEPNIPEPGPECGGLRLRLTVAPAPNKEKDAFNVELDLINVTNHPIRLTARWENYETNDFADYLHAAFSVRTDPSIEPFTAQVIMGRREARKTLVLLGQTLSPEPPQPEKTLQPGESVTVKWKSSNGHLKNKVNNPHSDQNPRFPVDGLYSVHGTVLLQTDDGEHFLRSNDQIVAAGGSVALPKYTYGRLGECDSTNGWAELVLGRVNKVEVGDKFIVLSGNRQCWELTVTNVDTYLSKGTLIPYGELSEGRKTTQVWKPERGDPATYLGVWNRY